MKEGRKTQYIKIEGINWAKWNPRKRTDATSLKKLRASIVDYGQVVPIIVVRNTNEGYDLIDGHRRVSVLIDLGKEEVEALVFDAADQATLWLEVNENQKWIDPTQYMEAYWRGGPLPERLVKKIKTIEDALGHKGMGQLVEAGISPHVAVIAGNVCSYIGWTGKEKLALVIYWLVHHKMQQASRRAMEDFAEPAVLISAIEGNCAIQYAWHAGE